MTKLDKYEHIWYQIIAYSAADVMGWRKHAYLQISQILNLLITKMWIWFSESLQYPIRFRHQQTKKKGKKRPRHISHGLGMRNKYIIWSGLIDSISDVVKSRYQDLRLSNWINHLKAKRPTQPHNDVIREFHLSETKGECEPHHDPQYV